MRRIGRTKGAAFLRRRTEQRILAVTGLYIQQSRETDRIVRSSFEGTKAERLIGSGDCVDQTSAEDTMLGVIEKAIVAGLVSRRGASTRGPVLFPASTMFSHGDVRVPSVAREKVKSAAEVSQIKTPSPISALEGGRRENIPDVELGALQIFYSLSLVPQYATRCRMDYANSLSSKAGGKM